MWAETTGREGWVRVSEHVVDVSWSRGEHEFTYPKYSRDHTWTFDGGETVKASANPVYLGSDESAFTTGGTHIIDGGWTM